MRKGKENWKEKKEYVPRKKKERKEKGEETIIR